MWTRSSPGSSGTPRIRRLAGWLGLVGILGVAVGFAGRWVPAADSLSILRPAFAAVAVLGLAVPLLRWPAILAVLAAAATVLPPFFAGREGGTLRVYSHNLWAGNALLDEQVAAIRAADPDVVALQEVSDANFGLLDLLAPDYPHRHLCRFSGWSGIALLSRLPFDGVPRCTGRRAMALARVRHAGGAVWVGSTHIPWPWPAEDGTAEAGARALLATLDGPVVLIGDFNQMPWSARVRRLAATQDLRLAGPVRPTLVYRRLPLPIDLALAPGGGTVERLGRHGSDHHALLADLRVTP